MILLVIRLQAKGFQDAVHSAALVAVVLALPALGVPLVRWSRREPAPMADQIGQAQNTVVIHIRFGHPGLARDGRASVTWRPSAAFVVNENPHFNSLMPMAIVRWVPIDPGVAS